MRLDDTVANDTALHLALMLLDDDLTDEIRHDAAEELSDLLGWTNTLVYVESVMHAQIMPQSANLDCARRACESASANLVKKFFKRLVDLGPAIRDVRVSWESIPTADFGSEEARKYAQVVFVETGVFRELVRNVANEECFDETRLKALRNIRILDLPGYREILNRWLKPLAKEHSAPQSGRRAKKTL